MYYEAVEHAFKLFPLDPPRQIHPGEFGRARGHGKLLLYGDLESLLGIKIETDEVSEHLEYFSEGVSKVSTKGVLPAIAQARVSFADRPSLYLRGKRTSVRIRNFQGVLAALSKAGETWNWRNRIIVETMYVENADIVCARSSKAGIDVRYDDSGLALPISFDAGALQQNEAVLHLPDASGVIAYGAIRLIFGRVFGASASTGSPVPFEVLDVTNPDDAIDGPDDE